MARHRLGPVEVALAVVAGSMLLFVAHESWGTWRRNAERARVLALAESLRQEGQSSDASRQVREWPRGTPVDDHIRPVRDAGAVRARIAAGSPGTYIHDLLAGQDSALFRWSDRTLETLRVWVQPRANHPNWRPEYVGRARGAFPEWAEAGFPVRFTFTLDSASADVRVVWTERFPAHDGQRVGRADRMVDRDGWIRSANLIVATTDSTGRPIPPEWVGAIARHEAGHALGLGHTDDSTSIMFPTSRTPRIGDADRATLRLLYTLPPGSLRAR